MDLVVSKREINTLRLELSPRYSSVHDAIVGHSVVLIVHDESIQKLFLYHLLNGSGPTVVLQSKDVLSSNWSLWGIAESVSILLESLGHLACIRVERCQSILTVRFQLAQPLLTVTNVSFLLRDIATMVVSHTQNKVNAAYNHNNIISGSLITSTL